MKNVLAILMLTATAVSVIPAQTPQKNLKIQWRPMVIFRTLERGRPPADDRFTGYILEGDRGPAKGRYLQLFTYSKSLPGDPRPKNAQEEHHDYRLIGFDQLKTTPQGDVIAVHDLNVRPNRAAAFEQFVRDKLHPAVANLRSDLGILYHKGYRGPNSGGYRAVFVMTREAREKYWPDGADSAEVKEVFKPLQPLAKELRTYLVPGSYVDDPNRAASVFESRNSSEYHLIMIGAIGTNQ